jgi:hypothetical protein
MPPLKDVLTKGLPPGYSPVGETEAAPPPAQQNDDAQFASPRTRCPLPPTNADADSLRTFQKGSSTPQFRVMPLVPPTGGSVTVTTGGGTSSSGSSSSGGSSSASAAKTASVTVNIPANSAILTRVTIASSFQIFSVAATAPVDVRLYGSQAVQSSDTARQVDAPVPAELTQNIILDVVFDTVPYFWNTQNIVGVNADSPQSTSLYVSVFNKMSTPLSNITIYITYVPIES